jgi:membrane protein
VMLMLIAFSASILLVGVEQFIRRLVPGADDILGLLTLLHVVPGLILFGSIYFVFVSLTPRKYRRLQCRKWPGAALVAAWWLSTTALLPVVLSHVGSYDLTYGSLASVIIMLIFFFVIGLGVVIGAELNAALAETPEPTPQEVAEAKVEVLQEVAGVKGEEEKA